MPDLADIGHALAMLCSSEEPDIRFQFEFHFHEKKKPKNFHPIPLVPKARKGACSGKVPCILTQHKNNITNQGLPHPPEKADLPPFYSLQPSYRWFSTHNQNNLKMWIHMDHLLASKTPIISHHEVWIPNLDPHDPVCLPLGLVLNNPPLRYQLRLHHSSHSSWTLKALCGFGPCTHFFSLAYHHPNISAELTSHFSLVST